MSIELEELVGRITVEINRNSNEEIMNDIMVIDLKYTFRQKLLQEDTSRRNVIAIVDSRAIMVQQRFLRIY